MVLPAPATDHEPIPFVMWWSGDPWTVTWHPPTRPPSGTAHGSQAICVSDAGHVLITGDGQAWGWPGGRPEGNETWLDTLRREVQEEACATVTEAQLLGFTQGRCLAG